MKEGSSRMLHNFTNNHIEIIKNLFLLFLFILNHHDREKKERCLRKPCFTNQNTDKLHNNNNNNKALYTRLYSTSITNTARFVSIYKTLNDVIN